MEPEVSVNYTSTILASIKDSMVKLEAKVSDMEEILERWSVKLSEEEMI